MFNTSPLKLENGNTVIISMFIMATLAALAVGALQLTTLNLESTHAHRKGKRAFYAAETGLDLAINDVLASFENLSVYTDSANNGGDANGYLTVNNYRGHDVKYKITNPQSRYLYETVQGNNILTNYAYTYDIEGESVSLADSSKETLRERIRILETPLVQWFIFYGGSGGNNSDLEITPGPAMTTWGRIHSNGDIYVRAGCGNQLRFQNFDPNGGTPLSAPHSITAAGAIKNWHKGSNAASCGQPRIKTTNNTLTWVDDIHINFFVDTEAEEATFNDFVFVNEPVIQAPSNSQFVRNGFYEQRSGNPQRPDVDGIRIIGQGGLGAGMTVEVSRPASNTDVTALVLAGETSLGNPYTGPMPIIRETLGVLKDCRENDDVDTTDIDLYALERWYQEYLADPANGGGALAGSGFLIYASRSPNAAFTNSADPMQAIRLMQIGAGSSPQLLDETTFATDNPVYIDGDFNTVSTKGVAIIGDAINILGNNWNDGKTCDNNLIGADAGSSGTTQSRVRAALFGGHTPTTSLGGTYGGGAHNYTRYHEDWTNVTADFLGSYIALWVSQQATGNWCQHGDCYEPPNRVGGWDTRFADPDFWPPFIPSIFSVERVGFLE